MLLVSKGTGIRLKSAHAQVFMFIRLHRPSLGQVTLSDGVDVMIDLVLLDYEGLRYTSPADRYTCDSFHFKNIAAILFSCT